MYLPKVEEIKRRRESAGLSKHQLSLNAGLSGCSLSRIETRAITKVHPLRARAIAQTLDCEIEEIFENESKIV